MDSILYIVATGCAHSAGYPCRSLHAANIQEGQPNAPK
jgi:hypothetical protein